MATQAEQSAHDPQTVGNAFVQRYYNILFDTPEMVHGFYKDASVISRPDSEGDMSSVSTVNGIAKMILSFDYKNCGVEILTVDAQESLGDGVILLVTGLFAGKDNMRRKFTQLFFLAPQEKGGYFVLNDVFRYVDEEDTVTVEISDADDAAPTAPVTPDPEPISASNHSVVTHSTATPVEEDANQSSLPLDNGNIPTVEKEVVGDCSVGMDQNDAHPVSEAAASNVQEDAPKKSYASVANELNFKKQPFQQKVSPFKPVHQARAVAAHEASSRPTAAHRPPSNNVAKNNNLSAKGYSIFVANLPMDATVEQLVHAFEQFGPIKPNGIQVRSYKQEKNCFGFVEFESANSMQSALEVSTIEIGNRTAHIEEKRANNSGGKYPPRKGGFRNDNFRSHGNFHGGRAYGRNNFENQGGFPGQARGATGRNGESNQKVHQNWGGKVPRQDQGQSQAKAGAQGGKN